MNKRTSAAVYPRLSKLRAAHQAQGMITPDKTYRMMEWEFHNPPSSRFDIDIEEAVKASADAGAEGLTLYTQDTWGYAFYPTDVGVRHPSLDYDLFGRELELAHKHGLSVSAYYCLHLNEQCVRSHPDWAWVNERGEAERVRWHFTCMDSPYRDYVLGMIREIVARYPIEQLFLDVFGQQFAYYSGGERGLFCFCTHTEAAWDRDHPGDPYREGFANREGWLARYRWHEKRTMIDLLDSIRSILRTGPQGTLLSLNGGPEAFPGEVLKRVDFVYNEPMTTGSGISIGSIMDRGWGKPGYQAGVFTQHGYVDTYPGSIPRIQADALIVQNARTFFVGNAPVIGGMDDRGFSRRWFDVAREHWEDVRNVDSLLGELEPVCSSAVLFSEATRDELYVQRRPQDFRLALAGAIENLVYAGRPVESIPEFRLTADLLDRFQLLVLPETEVLSSAHASLIRDWVERGGTLIATHRCGLLDEHHRPRPDFPLADVFGLHLDREEKRYAYDEEGRLKRDFFSTYLAPTAHVLARPLFQGTVALPGSFLSVRLAGADEVMQYRLPCMVEDMSRGTWFNWGPPPPRRESAGPAVCFHRFGQGQAIYAGVPIFMAMSARAEFGGGGERPFWIRDWLRELVGQLVPSPVIEMTPEPFTEYFHGSFFHDRARKLVLVQALNTVELLGKGKLRAPIRARIRANSRMLPVTGARMVWPRTRNLTIRKEGATKVIELPPLERYAAIYLKLRD
jgi:hypothetical protein